MQATDQKARINQTRNTGCHWPSYSCIWTEVSTVICLNAGLKLIQTLLCLFPTQFISICQCEHFNIILHKQFSYRCRIGVNTPLGATKVIYWVTRKSTEFIQFVTAFLWGNKLIKICMKLSIDWCRLLILFRNRSMKHEFVVVFLGMKRRIKWLFCKRRMKRTS